MEKNEGAAYATLSTLFDAGTFVELGAYIRRGGTEGETEGVVCGYGALGGRLVFGFSQDAARMAGALDARHAQKIALLYEKALAVGAPVIGFFDCAGAVVFDGAAALAGYGTLLKTVAGASGKVPQIAVIHGVCAGSMAALAALFDLAVVTESAQWYVSSPSLVGEEIGTAAYTYGNGAAALAVKDKTEALAAVRTLLSYLPDHAGEGTPADDPTDDPGRALSLAERVSAAEALAAAQDAGTFFEVYGGAAPTFKAGFARFGGISTVAVAADGKLTLAAVRKLTKLLRFADAFGLPVLTFVNCEGIEQNADTEPQMAAALAALAQAQTSADIARVTVVTGAAIGAGFILTGARSLGADAVFALPAAEIAALPAETAVAFLQNDTITKTHDRAAAEAEWRAAHATAELAAATGEVDDVVVPAALRARLCSALYMLAGKEGGAHAVLPL